VDDNIVVVEFYEEITGQRWAIEVPFIPGQGGVDLEIELPGTGLDDIKLAVGVNPNAWLPEARMENNRRQMEASAWLNMQEPYIYVTPELVGRFIHGVDADNTLSISARVGSWYSQDKPWLLPDTIEYRMPGGTWTELASVPEGSYKRVAYLDLDMGDLPVGTTTLFFR
jgi:hypothetical protein